MPSSSTPGALAHVTAKPKGKLKRLWSPGPEGGKAGDLSWAGKQTAPLQVDSDDDDPWPVSQVGGVRVELGHFGDARIFVDVSLPSLARGWPTAWLESPHVDYACCRCVTLAGQGVIAVPSQNMAAICAGDATGDTWSDDRIACLGKWLRQARAIDQICVLVPVPRNGHWALAVIWHPRTPSIIVAASACGVVPH